jgi:hypothetical protein
MIIFKTPILDKDFFSFYLCGMYAIFYREPTFLKFLGMPEKVMYSSKRINLFYCSRFVDFLVGQKDIANVKSRLRLVLSCNMYRCNVPSTNTTYKCNFNSRHMMRTSLIKKNATFILLCLLSNMVSYTKPCLSQSLEFLYYSL